ncbi:Eco57I restriction-modification methylase domain-containing protein [Kitasatospora viridis]|uniref:site-specific DNA-methyltransferase (adenine-specific) n=1 Tax=Kitasatospora viridis TaxID=281105 RepID=A0A561UMK4_9ACTN|nr:Eco57I restriction-modification methylase domain-containing protein [Kitasatospora viridis]TWG00592.1 Eco57I restriction-modification methylase [Kitasatospora viridis]
MPNLAPLTDHRTPSDLPAEAIEHGEVFTRRWMVDLILDLLGYTADLDLLGLTVVEPACGTGAFLKGIASRVSASCRIHGRRIVEASDTVKAFDLLERNVGASRTVVEEQLIADGWDRQDARLVARSWVTRSDYLLQPAPLRADFVVGNPPYIRLEDVPDDRMDAYRAACSTMGGRADVYVGFYEVALRSLKPGGRLGFICADRWMRNQYGRKLRRLVTRDFSIDLAMAMHDVDAFEEQVSAYPAVTIITNRGGRQGSAVAADTTRAFGAAEAEEFLAWYGSDDPAPVATPAYQAARMEHWFPEEDSWPTGSPARLAALEDLSERFRLLEDETTGTRVGIGIATGADKVFITDDAGLVEQDRLLPLAMVRDTTSGTLRWNGSFLVNPWTADGELVDLADHPRLSTYFRRHSEVLRKRYVAVKQPSRWYKTIDKVDHKLRARPKLLFPDMKLTIHPVLDEGGPEGLYPHHNLYFIVSDSWDMRVLGGLLLSKVAGAFVEAYAVRMRGGTLRFQAQYLRKIRVPAPEAIDEQDRAALRAAFDARDVDAATEAALRVYGLAELPD